MLDIMKKKVAAQKGITNKKARYDYTLGDEFVVGLSLTGAETKSLRRGHGHLKGAYVTVKDDELWLFNATITGDGSVPIPEEQRTRSRKLLAKRKEINQLIDAKQQGNTVLPLAILNQGRYIKLRIAVGRGKKKYDKRQILKKRDQERQIKHLSR